MNSNKELLPTVQFRRLADGQCQQLYWNCLEILESTGVRLYAPAALELLRKAGVTPTDGNRVRIPHGMVEKALTTAPSQVTFYDRNGRRALPVAGHRVFYGPGSDCLHIIDHRTSERRTAVLQDVVEAVTVADALPHVGFVMCMFLPHDVPQEAVDRHQMAAMLSHTTKPIIFVTNEFSGCVDAIAMAEAVAGSAEALQQRPFVGCYVNVTTGLIHNEEALQKLLFLSEKGIPFAYVPSTQGGVTAPVTPAGALAVSQAGALVGVVLSQLQREGAPIIMPGWGGNMLDMRTTVQPYADPDKQSLAADFVHWLGLPMFGLAGCSESKLVDQQAGIEAALTLMSATLSGANLVHDLGYLESGLTGSLAQLAICDEIVDWLSHFMPGVATNEETVPLDLIDAVGPDGDFLDSDHTYNHFRERWYPSLFERDNYDGWLGQGGQSLAERAAVRVNEILAEHQPEPLSETVQQTIQTITQQAEK